MSTEGPRQRGVRVLLADDSAGRRLLLRLALEDLPGVRVVAEAADGAAAVAAAASSRPDLAFVDVEMPVLDGLAAVALIRQRSPETRLVSFSADPAERTAGAARAAGADAYLEKPASDEEVAAVVRRLFPARAGFPPPRPAAEPGRPHRPGDPDPLACDDPAVLLARVGDGPGADLVVARANRAFTGLAGAAAGLVGQPWQGVAATLRVPVSTAALLAATRTRVALSWTAPAPVRADGTAAGAPFSLRVAPAGDGLLAVLAGAGAEVSPPAYRQG